MWDWFQDYPSTTTTKTKSMNAQVSSVPQDVEVNCGSLLKNNGQGYHYHLSKFHIYVLVYCNGLYLSGLLHSV